MHPNDKFPPNYKHTPYTDFYSALHSVNSGHLPLLTKAMHTLKLSHSKPRHPISTQYMSYAPKLAFSHVLQILSHSVNWDSNRSMQMIIRKGNAGFIHFWKGNASLSSVLLRPNTLGLIKSINEHVFYEHKHPCIMIWQTITLSLGLLLLLKSS